MGTPLRMSFQRFPNCCSRWLSRRNDTWGFGFVAAVRFLRLLLTILPDFFLLSRDYLGGWDAVLIAFEVADVAVENWERDSEE